MRTITGWPKVLGLSLCVLLSAATAPVSHADEAAGPQASAPSQVTAAFVKRIRSLQTKDPQGALIAIDDFLKQNAAFPPLVLVRIYELKARTLYEGMKDAKAALALYDEALKAYGERNERFTLLSYKAALLNLEKRPAEAEALLKAQLTSLLQLQPSYQRPHYLDINLRQYIAALQSQGRGSEALPLLKQIAHANLPSLGEYDWLYERLVELLLKSGGEEEALGWAKLHFMTCEFDDKSINHATQLLLKVWMTKDLTLVAGQSFVKAQDDAALPNPLAAVKLPAFDAAALAEQSKALGPKDFSEHFTVAILKGDIRAAMLEARRLMIDSPGAPVGLEEVCRLFKASDLNLKRANAFLEYYKSGVGENPLAAFLKEQAAG